MPRHRSTCTGGPPYSEAGSPLSLGRTCRFTEGRVPLFRGTRIRFPRDGGAPYPRNGSPYPSTATPLAREGSPFSEGRLTLFRETCSPLTRNTNLLTEGRVPISRGAVVPPYRRERYNPTSDGRSPLLRSRGTQFSTDGSQHPSDVYPRSVGLRHHLPSGLGPLFRRTGNPFSEECR